MSLYKRTVHLQLSHQTRVVISSSKCMSEVKEGLRRKYDEAANTGRRARHVQSIDSLPPTSRYDAY